MAKGEWIYDGNYKSYYYLTPGSYARNTWVREYYLKSNGKMAVNERTQMIYRVDGSVSGFVNVILVKEARKVASNSE